MKYVPARAVIYVLQHRPDARLLRTNTSRGPEFVLSTGGRVKSETAREIIANENVIVSDGGLINGYPQSWRWGRR